MKRKIRKIFRFLKGRSGAGFAKKELFIKKDLTIAPKVDNFAQNMVILKKSVETIQQKKVKTLIEGGGKVVALNFDKSISVNCGGTIANIDVFGRIGWVLPKKDGVVISDK